MFKRIATICTIAVLTSTLGCSKSNDQKLIGRWQGKIELNESEVSKTIEESEGDEITKDLLKRQFDAMAQTEITVEFKPNGEMTTSGKVNEVVQSTTSSWKATKDESNNLVVESSGPDGKDPEKITVRFENNDQFVTDPPGPNKLIGVIRFRRLR